MIKLKRGGTYRINAQVLGNGAPFDVSDWGIASQIRDRHGTLIADLDCQLLAEVDGLSSWYQIVQKPGENTANWPEETLYQDICYIIGGDIVHTETHTVTVEKAITWK